MSAITLLDGSIGQELVHRHGAQATPLWSTSVMIDRPALVGDLHADYFAAGATIATTNTYAVLTDRLAKSGLEGQIDRLLDSALAEATRARDAHGQGRIAGSLGPIGASYRPDIRVTADQAAAIYGANVQRLDHGVDLWLIETMSSVNHAETALDAVKRFTAKPVWLAVSVDDDDGSRLRSGEATSDIAAMIAALPENAKPQAILVNCSRPEAVAAGIDALNGAGLPFGAYANGFTRITPEFLKENPTVDALSARRDLDPDAYADFAMGWVAQGATIVGGCCEVGPAHIAELARRLGHAGHDIV